MYYISGVLPKTISEYSSEQMDSVEMLGKNVHVCVCACPHGKDCKMKRVRCLCAELFTCSTAQGLPQSTHRAVYSHPHL